jgi:DNA-binding transcriptional regulator YdaS (Cro superfamily)
VDKVHRLIEASAKTLGSQAALARELGVSRASVTNWKTGHEHVPDKHVLKMARIAGWRPLETAMEVYKERLGELAKTLAIGAVAIISTLGAGSADARPAALMPTADNV